MMAEFPFRPNSWIYSQVLNKNSNKLGLSWTSFLYDFQRHHFNEVLEIEVNFSSNL